MNGQSLNEWVNVTTMYTRSNTYTFYTETAAPFKPVQYVMQGYDSLLGSHYDKYIVDYSFFDDQASFPDSNFDIPKGEYQHVNGN